MPFVEVKRLLGTHHYGFASEIEAELGKAILEGQRNVVAGAASLSVEEQQSVAGLWAEGELEVELER